MRCTNIGVMLGEYADGYADERNRRIVEHHIQLCQTCRTTVLTTHQLGEQLFRLSLLPMGVFDRVPSIRRRIDFQLARYEGYRTNRVLVRAAYILVLLALYALLWFLLSRLLTLT